MADTTYAMLSALRSYPGIPSTGEDAHLQRMLNAAAEKVDDYCNTTFVPTTVTLEKYDGAGSRYLYLRHRPVISVTSVELDGSPVDTSAYVVDTAHGYVVIPDYFAEEETRNPRIWRANYQEKPAWPTGSQNIGITYIYGYAEVPDSVAVATCLIAASLYAAAQSRGVKAETLGPRSITYDEAGGLPDSARILLDKYREPELGG